MPTVPSYDPTGMVAQVGVLNFKKACAGALSPEETETRVNLPASLSFEQAARLVCAGLAGTSALPRRPGLPSPRKGTPTLTGGTAGDLMGSPREGDP